MDESKSNKPEFKPGNKPYYEYDGTVLNANVPWDEVVLELQEHGCTLTKIAKYAECSRNVLKDIVNKKYDGLLFRSGARILTLHSNAYPNGY